MNPRECAKKCLNLIEYKWSRRRAEPVLWSHEAILVRENIKDRVGSPNQIILLLGGGTIFSQSLKGIRTGYSDIDASDFISTKIPAYEPKINPREFLIYSGVSEDVTPQILDEMEVKIVKAINNSRDSDSFIMFTGSDMVEAIGSYLHFGLTEELEDKSIKLFLVWASHPVVHPETDALIHLETALNAASQKEKPGGVYIVSGTEVIPTVYTQKETWHDRPMRLFNINDEQALKEEIARREQIKQLADKLSLRFFALPFLDLIETMGKDKTRTYGEPPLAVSQTFGKRIESSKPKGKSMAVKTFESLHHKALDPYDHPSDASRKVRIINANLLAPIPTYEDLSDAEAVLFILNHSATTRRDIALTIRDICARRFAEGRPLAAFVVTETGEPRKWDVETGIYPSGRILKDYATLIPGHIKPTIVKLWAAIHKFGMKFGPELTGFMLTNYEGEIVEGFADEENVRTAH